MAIKFVQVPGRKIVSRHNQIGLCSGDGTDKGTQRCEALISMRPACRMRLFERVRTRTKRLNPEPGIGQSNSQAGRWHPVLRRRN